MLQVKRSQVRELALKKFGRDDIESQNQILIMISVASAARTSYTVVGDEKEINYQKMIELHDRLISQNPPHSSPMEHCAKAMSDEEYVSWIKGQPDFLEYENDNIAISYLKTYGDSPEAGWCRNFKGFIQYRTFLEDNINI